MKIIFWALSVLAMAATSCCAPSRSAEEVVRPSEYVSTLVGTQSDYSLSAGNTYPAIALPWGMNFWTPQTGRMGDGWTYTYGAHTLRGFKQTHQPSPWMNDYGQFAVMPVRGNDKLDEESRQSWFSHQSEQARPYYYSVYLADHDVKAEVAPTERAAILRFTFPESEESGVVVDAFDRGSSIEMVDDHTLAGYTTRNSGGVPDNFRNYFVLRFDKPFSGIELTDSPSDYKAGSRVLYPEGGKRVEGEHAVAKVHFATRRGEQVNVRVASSFISPEQAVRNLESELGSDDFETVTAKAQQRWDDVLGRIRVEGGSDEQMRTFYSCLYRSSRASSTKSTPRGIPSTTAPTTARCVRVISTPIPASGIRSAASSRCSTWSTPRSTPRFRPDWPTWRARMRCCPSGRARATAAAWWATTPLRW